MSGYLALVIAALSACIALGVGLANRRVAKRALELAEKQELRRESNIELYLTAAVSRRRPSLGDRLISVEVLVSNPTDRGTSVVAVDLRLTYEVAVGVRTTLALQPDSKEERSELADGPEPAIPPIRIGSNDAVNCLFVFQLADELIQDRRIDLFEIYVRDLHGFEARHQMTILREEGG